jgi:HEAT repeat protein
MKRFLTLPVAALLLGAVTGAASAQNTAADLAKLLKDQKSVEVRRAAAFALKYNLQSGDVIDALIDAFKDPDEVVRSNASDAIVLLAPKLTVTPLTAALRSNQPGVRVQAARTLGRIKYYVDEAVPNLVFLLRDDDYEVRQAAAEALKRIHTSTREY